MSNEMIHLVWVRTLPTGGVKTRIGIVVELHGRQAARESGQRKRNRKNERGYVARLHALDVPERKSTEQRSAL